MTPMTGVLEWVDNTVPIGDFPRKIVHRQRYFGGAGQPSSWDFKRCYEKMKRAREASAGEKRRVFDEVCTNFPPIFHHFFLERYVSYTDIYIDVVTHPVLHTVFSIET